MEPDRAGGWTVTLELSGVMEASCFAVEGGRGSGEASASLSQRKLYGSCYRTGTAGTRDQIASGVYSELDLHYSNVAFSGLRPPAVCVQFAPKLNICCQ